MTTVYLPRGDDPGPLPEKFRTAPGPIKRFNHTALLSRPMLQSHDLEPRKAQREGAAWLRAKGHGMLWDPPGVGKTFQAAMAMVRPTIWSGSSIAAAQCYDWLRTHLPTDIASHVHLLTGKYMSRSERILRMADVWDDNDGVFVINHEMFRAKSTDVVRAGKTFKEFVRDEHGNPVYEYPLPPALTIVVDESHHMRGRHSFKSRGAVDIARSAPFVFELTASPIYKDADDLYQQLRILRPDVFTSYGAFEKHYLNVVNNGWHSEVTGVKDMAQLMAMLRHYALGRTYDEMDVPELVALGPTTATPSPTYRNRIATLAKSYRDEHLGTFALTASEALAHVASLNAQNEDKLEALADKINELAPRGDGTYRGALVFCHLRNTVRVVTDYLNKHAPYGGSWLSITGDMSPERRRKLAATAPNLVATIDSMSESVDASHLRIVADYEHDYLPGKVYQAYRRVARYRTDGSVDNEPVLQFCVHLKFCGDEAVHRCLDRRTTTATTVLDEVIKEATR